MKQLTVASLYGGVGGGMLGFVQAGFKPLWLFDDRDFVSEETVTQSWFEFGYNVKFYSSLVHPVNPALYRPLPGVDVIVGSPPCKRFSRLAMRDKERLNFEPQDLEYVKFLIQVKELIPTVWVLEMIPAIEKHFKFENNAERDCAVLVDQTDDSAVVTLFGYRVMSVVLNSADFGVPQTRKRLYSIGISSHIQGELSFKGPVKKGGHKTVAEAFDFLKDVANMELPNHSANRIVGFAALEPGASYYGTANNKRPYLHRPAPTVTSHRTQMVHPIEPRTLSVRENLRLMGYPDEFVLYGPRTKQLDCAGCSITPPVTEFLARQIAVLLS